MRDRNRGKELSRRMLENRFPEAKCESMEGDQRSTFFQVRGSLRSSESYKREKSFS